MTSTAESLALYEDMGGYERLKAIGDEFYLLTSLDVHNTKFVSDFGESHGELMAMYIAEKMGAPGEPWTMSRPPNSRSRSHRKAWHSKKRPRHHQGRRFKVWDCRRWMRLFFWACREQELDTQHPVAFAWVLDFVQHSIAIYERSAPPFARLDAEWSADPANIEEYKANGRNFLDLHQD